MAMKAPREFEDFCRGFHQDAFRMYPGLPEAIGAVLENFDARKKKVLKDFILGLLNNDDPSINSGTELKRLWQKNNSDRGIGGGAKGTRRFFGEVLKQLG
jgi:hypothetical protein